MKKKDPKPRPRFKNDRASSSTADCDRIPIESGEINATRFQQLFTLLEAGARRLIRKAGVRQQKPFSHSGGLYRRIYRSLRLIQSLDSVSDFA